MKSMVEKRNAVNMEWRNIYRGIIMGISDLIPGVSGGTIAVILGIYDRLLEAISGFFSKEWKKHIGFLIPLGIGVGSALLLLSKVIDYLLTHYFAPTQFFFMGLIIGILPILFKQVDVKHNFKASHVIILVIAAAGVASMAFFSPDKSGEPITSLGSMLTIVGLFLAGWLGSMAMLLPGISGSFILLLLGVYPTAINALSTLNIPIAAVIGSGVIVGFIVSSKAIRYLLANFEHTTYAVIIGLVIGSIAVVFPGIPNGAGLIISSILTFIAGFSVVTLISAKSR